MMFCNVFNNVSLSNDKYSLINSVNKSDDQDDSNENAKFVKGSAGHHFDSKKTTSH